MAEKAAELRAKRLSRHKKVEDDEFKKFTAVAAEPEEIPVNLPEVKDDFVILENDSILNDPEGFAEAMHNSDK